MLLQGNADGGGKMVLGGLATQKYCIAFFFEILLRHAMLMLMLSLKFAPNVARWK